MKIFQQKFFCLLALLLIIGQVYGQYGRVRFNYRSEIEKHLFPKIDTTTTKEIVLFCATPLFDSAEQSIRIVEIGNQSIIEVRVLEKNLWGELHKIKASDSLSIKTYLFSAPVSESFRNKMLVAFSKVIVLHNSTIKPKKIIRKSFGHQNGKLIGEDEVEGPDIFDGTSYLFRINEIGSISNTTISCPLGSDDFRYLVSMANMQMINDLKNDLFNESKYDIFN